MSREAVAKAERDREERERRKEGRKQERAQEQEGEGREQEQEKKRRREDRAEGSETRPGTRSGSTEATATLNPHPQVKSSRGRPGSALAAVVKEDTGRGSEDGPRPAKKTKRKKPKKGDEFDDLFKGLF